MENNTIDNLVPSIRASFSFGWSKMFERSFLPLFLAVIIVGILNGPVGANMNFDGDFNFNMIFLIPIIIFGLAYNFMVLPVIKYGENFLFLEVLRDKEADFKLLFDGFKTKYLNIVLANLIVFALVMIGFMMLIIPGIIIWCRLSFVSYLVMDKGLEPMKAVEKSWELTRGQGWRVFGLAIVSFFVFIGGLLVLFFGVLISIMWIHAAYASFYQALLNEKEDNNPIPILGVNEQ
jgi:uncharacterized membrane protein